MKSILSFRHYYPPTLQARHRAAAEQFASEISRGEYVLESVSCANCGQRDDQLLFSNDRYGVPWRTVLCRNCGLVYSNPRFDQQSNSRFYSSDEYRALFSPTSLSDVSPRYEAPSESNSGDYHHGSCYEFIVKHAGEFQSIVDVGAAGGEYLVPFIADGKRCAGVEPSPILVAEGVRRGIDLEVGDDSALQGQYDVLMLRFVLEHFRNPADQLFALRDKISDGGKLYVEVPGFGNHVPAIQSANAYYFSKTTLKSILARAGFEIEQFREVPGGRPGLVLMALASKSPFFSSADSNAGEVRRILKVVGRARRTYFQQRLTSRVPSVIRRSIRGMINIRSNLS